MESPEESLGHWFTKSPGVTHNATRRAVTEEPIPERSPLTTEPANPSHFCIRPDGRRQRPNFEPAVFKLGRVPAWPGARTVSGETWMTRLWRVLAIILLGAALALAILNGWYHG